MFNFMEMVGGQEIQFTNLKDQSRTFGVGLHAREPADRRRVDGAQGLSAADRCCSSRSAGWSENGRGIRLQHLYLNEPDHAVPTPPLRGQARCRQPGQPQARPDRIDPGAR